MDIIIRLTKLFPWQTEVKNAKQRHKLIVVSRQCGKTTLAKDAAIRALLRGERVLWIAPVFDQVKTIFRTLSKTLSQLTNFVSTPKELRLLTGGHIQFKSADNPDNLRSMNYQLIIMDEAAFIDEEILKVISPMIATTGGRLLMISTPNGHGWFYDHFERCQKDEDWYVTQRDYTCSPLLTENEILKLKLNMTPSEFSQEFLANFISAKGSIFPAEWLQNMFVAEMPTNPARSMMAVDLSAGKISSDYQGVVYVAWHDRCFYVDAYAERMPVDLLIDKVKALYNSYRPEGIAWESNSFQWLAIDSFYKAFGEEQPPKVYAIDNKINKEIRISRLSSILSRGQLKILNNRGGRILYNQLCDFGSDACKFDDLADALEMAHRTIVEA